MHRWTIAQAVRSFALPIGLAVALWLVAGAGLRGHQALAQHGMDHAAGTAQAAALPVPAAGEVIIELSGFTFSPTVVTIEPGQTVTWVRRSGAHNVAADDGSYRSGAVSSDWTTFSHTFSEVGESRYYCEQHGGPGGSGMSGLVLVQTSGAGERKLYLPMIAQ